GGLSTSSASSWRVRADGCSDTATSTALTTVVRARSGNRCEPGPGCSDVGIAFWRLQSRARDWELDSGVSARWMEKRYGDRSENVWTTQSAGRVDPDARWWSDRTGSPGARISQYLM